MKPNDLQDEMDSIRKQAAAASSEPEETEQAESPTEFTDPMTVIRKRREARRKREAEEQEEGEAEQEQPEAEPEMSDALLIIQKRREARQKRAEAEEQEEPAEAEQPLADKVESEESEEEGRFYVVEKGDSLWSIAEKVYGDGTRWKEIRKANKDVIKDPKIIRPGWKLRIP